MLIGSKLSHKAIIMIYLPRRPSHQDMYDLKMEALVEIRGSFKPIQTAPSTCSTAVNRFPNWCSCGALSMKDSAGMTASGHEILSTAATAPLHVSAT